MTANNFDEFVTAIAEEAPHAVVLDWYRRLELMLRDYFASRHIRYANGRDAERMLAADGFVGAEIAGAVAKLRLVRNRVAHGPQPISSDQAIAFAREALSLIGLLWQAQEAPAA